MRNTPILQPESGAGRYWADLWRQRELLAFLAWRDILVRYRQTAFGIAWALLRPLLILGALTLAFGVVGRLPADGAPYLLMVAAGLLPWHLFAGALTESGHSLVQNASMVTQIWLPRMILPARAAAVGVVDSLVSLSVVASLAAVRVVKPPLAKLAPVLVAATGALSLAVRVTVLAKLRAVVSLPPSLVPPLSLTEVSVTVRLVVVVAVLVFG